ncbi:hypothetical protein MUY27_12665 [Mucilaginibacter sp. RS28]|uniref:ApeI dehydratase-like domain-containing protein n=1 Tax=Mucilaginibacter straminoryzae TaxID=2932774 RepID=A0A9X1X403_9SPHI|nr:hypothetical protein [Mucilaginibacter straminoryzae]MCJ8210563.1 hypothetical protein [Mucilaginibacter straminoryzae]
MLKDSLYTVNALKHADQQIEAMLVLHPGHAIFKGHYPTQPVLPGACMLQMIKEVLEQALDRQLQLIKAGQIKFLNMIDPEKNAEVGMLIKYIPEDNLLKVTATLTTADGAACKLQGMFQLN